MAKTVVPNFVQKPKKQDVTYEEIRDIVRRRHGMTALGDSDTM